MSIKQEIKAWDGKSAEAIQAIYDSHHMKQDFADIIIGLSNDRSIQNGATWLLKTWLTSKNQLDNLQAKTICVLLNKFDHWESKLHALQCIPYMQIQKSECKKVEKFLRESLNDKNKFVRAWSYNGFYELAIQHPEYQKEAKQMLDEAMQDEAASVKARIRNILKKGF